MVAHPRKAVPGAKRGRKPLLPLSRLGEAYALAVAGFTMEEIARELGVDRSTLLRSRKRSPEFWDTIARGRDEYNAGVRRGLVAQARQLAAIREARLALTRQQEAEQQRLRAAEARALLGDVVMAPKSSAIPVPSDTSSSSATPAAAAPRPWPDVSYDHHGGIEPPARTEIVPLVNPLAPPEDGEDYALPLDDPY